MVLVPDCAWMKMIRWSFECYIRQLIERSLVKAEMMLRGGVGCINLTQVRLTL